MQVWEVIFRGHVQGVGFRYTAFRLAQRLPVAGWVKNLPDGSVKMAIRGKPGDRDEFLHAIQSHFEGMIREMTIESIESPEVFHEFRILR